MIIIEIKSLNGCAHRNQICEHFKALPEGWAVVPDSLETANFPFGEVTTELINGVMTVTKWIAGEMPEIEEIEKPVTETEQLRADVDFIAIMTGVEL